MTQPTQKQLKVLRTIAAMKPGGTSYINSGDAEECVDRGWVETTSPGGYRLTEKGRAVLRQAGSR